MTPEAQELAHVIHHFMPEAFAEIWRKEAARKAEALWKRDQVLIKAFQCFEKGHQLDSLEHRLVVLAPGFLLLRTRCARRRVKDSDTRGGIRIYRSAAAHGHSKAQY